MHQHNQNPLLTPLNSAGMNSQLHQLFRRQLDTASSAACPALPQVIQDLLARPVDSFKPAGIPEIVESEPLTHIAFILDESQSMNSGKEETVVGFNEQLRVVREGADQAGSVRFTGVRFNDNVVLRCVAGDLAQVEPLTMASYVPDGCTALYDAVGLTVESLLRTEGINRSNTAVLVTVFTDGRDNRSKQYSPATIKALIERLEATGRWTFALVGPQQEVTHMAAALSVKASNIAGFDVTSVLDKRSAFTKVASASAQYMSLRAIGETQAVGLFAPGSP